MCGVMVPGPIKSEPLRPFLIRVATKADRVRPGEFPFTLPFLERGLELELKSYVTFFVGENGSGKSTLIEAIADCCGFNPSGGNRNHLYGQDEKEPHLIARASTCWMSRSRRCLRRGNCHFCGWSISWRIPDVGSSLLRPIHRSCSRFRARGFCRSARMARWWRLRRRRRSTIGSPVSSFRVRSGI